MENENGFWVIKSDQIARPAYLWGPTIETERHYMFSNINARRRVAAMHSVPEFRLLFKNYLKLKNFKKIQTIFSIR